MTPAPPVRRFDREHELWYFRIPIDPPLLLSSTLHTRHSRILAAFRSESTGGKSRSSRRVASARKGKCNPLDVPCDAPTGTEESETRAAPRDARTARARACRMAPVCPHARCCRDARPSPGSVIIPHPEGSFREMLHDTDPRALASGDIFGLSSPPTPTAEDRRSSHCKD